MSALIFPMRRFSSPKKIALWVVGEYNINDKSWVSWAGMYRRETVADYRPRVGGEPRRSMMWDSNLFSDSYLK
jgi:hypothetical protein